MSSLLSKLRDKDKKGLFNSAQVKTMYSTGFLPIDYRNGYKVNVVNGKNETVSSYDSVGVQGGTFTTVVGKTQVAKTTWVIQTAYNIVKKFDDAFVMIYDLEQSLNYTRIRNITRASQDDLENKFILRQEKNYLEDVFDSIVTIGNMKEENKDTLKYDTGLLDEFGRPIKVYQPTVVIIDSLPFLTSKNNEDVIQSQTIAARNAQMIKQFYVKLMPLIATYNINIFVINHVNAKIEINPFSHTQNQVMYLAGDKSLPGGNAPLYLAHLVLEFISGEKYKAEDDGFDGFLVKANFIKSRSNKAGQMTSLVYNQEFGFDPILSLYKLAEDNGMVDGRNPYRYFKGHQEVKFSSKKFREEFSTREELRDALRDVTLPILESMVSDPDLEKRKDE